MRCLLVLILITPALAQTVPCGFTLSEHATVPGLLTLAPTPPGGAYGDGLLVGTTSGPEETGGPEFVWFVDTYGDVSLFATLEAEADPISLAFPPTGSPFGEYLHVSANNRDFGQPLDQGGAIQVIDPLGNWTDLAGPTGTSCNGPAFAGLGEPNDIAFDPGSAFGGDLYVANSTDYPGDIVRVTPGGGATAFVDDQLFDCAGVLGMWSVSLAFGPGGDFGTDLYFGDVNLPGIRTVDATGTVIGTFLEMPSPNSLEFGPGGAFGTDLYVGNSNGLFRVRPDASWEVFASGLGAIPLDGIEFSADGDTMYVGAADTGTIWRIEAGTCATTAGAVSYGAGKPGQNGVPLLSSAAPPVLGGTTDVSITNGLAGATPLVFFGLAPAALPFDGGTLLVDPLLTVTLVPLDGAGELSLAADLPCDLSLCGVDAYLQAMFQDPAATGAAMSAQTNGLHWTFGL